MNTSEYINKLTDTWKRIDSLKLEQLVETIHAEINNKKRFFIVGNGGSSSTASHFVNDWKKILKCDAICLSDNVATLTAIANDISYDEIFSFQLEISASKGDVLVALSGSGNSRNIVNACQKALKLGMTVIALTGFDGGETIKLGNYSFHCPISDMQIVEDMHLSFGHMVAKCGQ